VPFAAPSDQQNAYVDRVRDVFAELGTDLFGLHSERDPIGALPLVSDGTLHRILEKLCILEGERVSYRTLDVEEIGSVYQTIMGFGVETAAGTPSPVMLTGLEQSLNLCVDAAGDWLADVYCPAYVRRYPFCTARVGADAEQTVICVDESALDDTAPALFTAEGEESPLWQSRLKLIQELEAAGRQTEVFCARLQALQLLEPFDADIQPASGERKRLSGMFRVSESRLNTLPAETLTELMRSGFLSRIYAHLMSLDNFQRLLALDANRLNAMPRH
jgi:hypothetical protein